MTSPSISTFCICYLTFALNISDMLLDIAFDDAARNAYADHQGALLPNKYDPMAPGLYVC